MKKLLFVVLVLILSVHLSNSQWVQISDGIGVSTAVYTLASSGNNIFAGTQSGVYLSTNNGANWVQTPLNNRYVYALAVSGNYIFAGTQNDYGLYISTNNGASWNQSSLDHRFVYSLLVDGTNIYAGTEYNNVPMGIYKSTDNGTSWNQTSLNNRTVRSLAVNGNNIFAGTASNGIYLSTNNGTSWSQTSFNTLPVYSLAINGNSIFAGTISTGLYVSTDNGTTWNLTQLANQTVYTIAQTGNNLFAGTYQYGVFVSNNSGANWNGRSEGFPNGSIVYSLHIMNNYIFAGTNGAGSLYRRPLSELVAIQPVSSGVPNSFSLSQNYPNPFNPSTNIKFQIPAAGFVRIIVYDVQGKEIETLVNQNLKAGTFSVDWNASKYSSGVYFYRIESDGFTDIKKMILIK